MKRQELLNRYPFTVPEAAKIRVIIDTDAKNEADDQFAIMHHLLTPAFDVKAVCAAHFEEKIHHAGGSMEASFREIQKVLALVQIDDVPALRGCPEPLSSEADCPDSEAVDFLIQEARREDSRPLFVAVQGAMTNIAAALNKAPDIGSKITVIWNGGGPYPAGRPEFNVMQDPHAVRVLLNSKAAVWQIPQDVYAGLEITLAELAHRVAPCGSIGKYLFDQLVQDNLLEFNPHFLLRTGENWTLGDNSTIAVLIQNQFRGNWHLSPAPTLREDLCYDENPNGKPIRIYTALDVRMTLEDFYAKLHLIYS